MDFVKEYIVQAILAASNNLRLSSEKIEVVAIFRERFTNSNDLLAEINILKKFTEFSKFSIKIGELYSTIETGKIDFLKISEKFKEHSHYLVKDLSCLLDVVTPNIARSVFKEVDKRLSTPEIPNLQETKPIQSKESYDRVDNRSSADKIKEKFILDDLDESSDFIFENYVETILKPIKKLDPFLIKLGNDEINLPEVQDVIITMRKHAELSKKVGFEILCNMHLVFAKGLELIKEEEVIVNNEIIEDLRACLIVIVAIVRSKDVDITNYLTRAENFGKSLNLL